MTTALIALRQLFEASKVHDPDDWTGEPAMILAAQVLREPPFGKAKGATVEGLVERYSCITDPGFPDGGSVWVPVSDLRVLLAQLVASREARREDFENWASHAVGQPSFAGKYVRGGVWSYNHNIVEQMWQCWRAALTIGSE